MKAKIISQQFGPIHFETRFIPFITNNRDILHNFTYVVNDGDKYLKQATDCKILNMDTYRKNHWSNELEIVYPETDHKKFIQNFKEFCIGGNKYLPLNLVRFALLDCHEDDILNIAFFASNVFFTNKNSVIEDYFNSIPIGVFHAPFFNHTQTVPFYLADTIEPFMKERFPGLTLPKDFWSFDGFQFGMHFKNKQDLMLFYEMWDYITYLHYTEPQIMPFLSLPAGYTKYEQFVGYIMRIFELNFGYTIFPGFKYWDTSALAQHISLPHDTWYNSGIRAGWEHFGFTLDNTITSVSEFIQKNKNALIKYHSVTQAHLLKFEITDSTVIMRHFNS